MSAPATSTPDFIDHDLRARTREVLRVADGAIEAGDPLDVWDEFEGWLYRRTNEEVMQTYRLLHERAHALARRAVGSRAG